MRTLVAFGLTNLVLLPVLAAGHVAPAVTENNRYITLAPLSDRVRLSYTVFYGQVPGLEARMEMDRDRDSKISDQEKRAFADQLAGRVARGVQITVDGKPTAIEWKDMHVGLGKSDTSDDAFSVDLVAELCLAGEGPTHVIALSDGFELDKPGEGELKLELAPGIEIVRSGIGDAAAELEPKITWQGPATDVRDPGYVLEFRAGEDAFAPDQPCQPSSKQLPEARVRQLWLFAGLGAGLAMLAALFVAIRQRRKTKRPASEPGADESLDR